MKGDKRRRNVDSLVHIVESTSKKLFRVRLDLICQAHPINYQGMLLGEPGPKDPWGRGVLMGADPHAHLPARKVSGRGCADESHRGGGEVHETMLKLISLFRSFAHLATSVRCLFAASPGSASDS